MKIIEASLVDADAFTSEMVADYEALVNARIAAKEISIEKLKAIVARQDTPDGGDVHENRRDAAEVLCELIEGLGMDEVGSLFRSVRTWFS